MQSKTRVSYLGLFAVSFGLAGTLIGSSMQTNTAKADDLPIIHFLKPDKKENYTYYSSQSVKVVPKEPQWFYNHPSLTKTRSYAMNHDISTVYKFAYYGNQKVAYTDWGWIAADNLAIVGEWTNMDKYQELLKQAQQLKPSSKITKKYYTEFVKGNAGRIVIKRNNVKMYKRANTKSKTDKVLKKGTKLYVSDLIQNKHGWFFEVFKPDGSAGYVSSEKAQVYFSGKKVRTLGM